jgi:hypothetical protein
MGFGLSNDVLQSDSPRRRERFFISASDGNNGPGSLHRGRRDVIPPPINPWFIIFLQIVVKRAGADLVLALRMPADRLHDGLAVPVLPSPKHLPLAPQCRAVNVVHFRTALPRNWTNNR